MRVEPREPNSCLCFVLQKASGPKAEIFVNCKHSLHPEVLNALDLSLAVVLFYAVLYFYHDAFHVFPYLAACSLFFSPC